MASQRWNRAASAATRYNAMLRQPTPAFSSAAVNPGARYPTPTIPSSHVQPNIVHGGPHGSGQYPLAWSSLAPMPPRYMWPIHPIPTPLGYGLPPYGWMQPTLIPHDVRPVADDMPLDLSCPRPSSRDFAQLVDVPVDRPATPSVQQQPPSPPQPQRPMPVFDITESQPSRPKKKSALNEGLV